MRPRRGGAASNTLTFPRATGDMGWDCPQSRSPYPGGPVGRVLDCAASLQQ